MQTDLESAIHGLFGNEPERRSRPHSRTAGEPVDAPDAHTVRQQAGKLAEIAVRIERFLKGQLQRLEEALQQSRGSLELRDKAKTFLADLQRERADWEQQRASYLRALAEEAEQLRDAWNRLESEERRVMAARESAAGNQAAVFSATEAVSAGNPPRQTETGDFDRIPSDQRDPESASPEAILLQFQQLKREIRKHAQRRPS